MPMCVVRATHGLHAALRLVRKLWLFAMIPILAVCEPAIAQSLDSNQVALRDQLLRMLPKSQPWEDWLKRSGELPPDFERLPSVPGLPDPLRRLDGSAVQSLADWAAQRLELLKLFQHYVTGTVPPSPGNVRVKEARTQTQGSLTVRAVTLEFGPDHKATLSLELIVPPGSGPLPVFLTQDNHRAWALIAASRGYLGCIYAGADSRDDTGAFTNVWPQYDWTKLTRRAWAASRCVDYLLTLPEVDPRRIALTGHSRNGKTSLIAAAMDERIRAVILSSAGAGGTCPYRLFSETQFGEGIELITRTFPDWLHPRLRFYAGREHKLPIDQPELIACLAPRPCLISTALNDSVESVWAVEQSYYSAQRVYYFLQALPALQLRYRDSGHETGAQDIEDYLDWLNRCWAASNPDYLSRPIYPTYRDWLQTSQERINSQNYPVGSWDGLLTSAGGNPILTTDQWQTKTTEIKNRVLWALGDPPPIEAGALDSYGAEPPHRAALLDHQSVPSGVGKKSLNFGNYVCGDLYYPAGADNLPQKLPVIIWLHPISNPHGYVAGYRRGEPVHITLARAGYAVFCFDQIGHGSRLVEVNRFYQRYPHWSLMGKTVADTRAAVQAMAQVRFADLRRIYLLGYDTGGMAALHAAALDDRVAGVICVAGFSPMRSATSDKGTGGIARWSQWLPLLPRLGAFVGFEDRIPYDYHELLALIAPRPVLLVQPRIDYLTSLADAEACARQAQRVYEMLKAPQRLAWLAVDDYNRLSPELQSQLVDQLKMLDQLK
jgi:pimeloyl-ACP methyl ester carboxylesterase